jgi:hypothetical protein
MNGGIRDYGREVHEWVSGRRPRLNLAAWRPGGFIGGPSWVPPDPATTLKFETQHDPLGRTKRVADCPHSEIAGEITYFGLTARRSASDSCTD